MKVVWIVPRVNLHVHPDGLSSNVASIRYRAIIPAQGLVARGHQASVIGLDAESFNEVHVRSAVADRVVFIKNYFDSQCSERMIEELHARGVKTLFDLTDDRFKEQGAHLQHMVGHADAVITVSPVLQQIIRQNTGRESAIAGDPYEGRRGAARWAPDARRLKALWFGHESNIRSLQEALPSLLEAGRIFPMDLRIVTADVHGMERDCKAFNSQYRHRLSLRYAKWSLEETWNSLAAADFVVIPGLPNMPGSLAKSPNRIIEALWAGRFVVAHPISSYMEFKDWAWIGGDLAEGIAWMADNAASIVGRVSAAQDHIAARYSPDSIASRWEQILEKA